MTNLLLAVLPEEERRRITPFCEPVTLSARARLCAPDEPIEYVYFPHGGACSTLVHARSGEAVEVGLVGREGMVGLPLVLDEGMNPFEVLVQIPGDATRIARDAFRTHALESGHCFCDALLKYANLYMGTIAQTAVCNRVHRIEQRLARWLLEMRDRASTDDLPMTHELLALMLGAYRPSITNALKALQDRNVVRVGRGHVMILDAVGLEQEACECHETIRRRTAATLSEIRRLAACAVSVCLQTVAPVPQTYDSPDGLQSLNEILKSLPAHELKRLQPYFKTVPLTAGQRLCSVDEHLGVLWFPETGAVSRLVQLLTGETVEAGIVGNDGVVGLPPVLGGARSIGACTVQIDGSALSMTVSDFREHVREARSPLLDALLMYANLLIATLGQLTACHCLHRIEQRLSRCILQLHDRVAADRVRTTHDVLSEFLGVHRPSVTYALQALAATGVIALERRSIIIRDRDGLVGHACECYGAIRRLTEQELERMRALRAG